MKLKNLEKLESIAPLWTQFIREVKTFKDLNEEKYVEQPDMAVNLAIYSV